ncbi:MAG: hypothetical protein IT406_02125 [Candidatus Yanofskybacteria bacterium]|nr:hypothetical protein [Candidatus Yanofskybacteria bacterium]
MNATTRKTLLGGLLVLIVGALGVWWYSGFSLEFMKFFAAEPGADTLSPTACTERPACLDATPPCDVAEPAGGWCPSTKSSTGNITCAPATQTVVVGGLANVGAAGGDGTYTWLGPESSALDTTRQGAQFGARYGTPGTKKILVESGRTDRSGARDIAVCTVIVQ